MATDCDAFPEDAVTVICDDPAGVTRGRELPALPPPQPIVEAKQMSAHSNATAESAGTTESRLFRRSKTTVPKALNGRKGAPWVTLSTGVVRNSNPDCPPEVIIIRDVVAVPPFGVTWLGLKTQLAPIGSSEQENVMVPRKFGTEAAVNVNVADWPGEMLELVADEERTKGAVLVATICVRVEETLPAKSESPL